MIRKGNTKDADNTQRNDKTSQKEHLALPSDSVLLIVEFDMAAYRRKHNSKAVKKTLSIPEWLNEEALALGINFSQVLQDALIQKVGR